MSIGIPVKVGASQIIVTGATFEDAAQVAQVVWQEIAQRLPPDALVRVRTPKSDRQYEYYSPGLKAARKVSKSKAENAAHPDFPEYIGVFTPWVRAVYQKGLEVMFDNVNEAAIAVGFEEPLRWYEAYTLSCKAPCLPFVLDGTPGGLGDVFYVNGFSVVGGYRVVNPLSPPMVDRRAEQIANKWKPA